MAKKRLVRIVTVVLCVMLACFSLTALSGCGKKKGKTLVIMSEELNGLFNPFFSTTGSDIEVLGQTQISMLTTDDDGSLSYGENEPVVVLDYKKENTTDKTVYTFVLKNGIEFSDGVPLTMNDVLFNMYVYLDPAYTGSTTMYSTDIVGLQAYRMQKNVSEGIDEDAAITTTATTYARNRISELVNLFQTTGRTSTAGSYEATEAQMTAAIAASNPGDGYKNAIGVTDAAAARTQLQEDYNLTLTTFKEELQSDYASAKDSFTENPYKDTGEFDEVTSFMYMEGYVTLHYAKGADGKDDKSKIERVERNYSTSVVKDKDSAINYVYGSKVNTELHLILSYWGTANTLTTEYISKAKEVLLHANLKNGQLAYPNISGIVSLGHQSSTKGSTVTIGDKHYTVATNHNTDGTVAESNAYDVLQITINGVDPKAIWNFGFTVAPYHYYSDPDKYPVNIENNQFGVEWSTFNFMKNVIQGNNKWGASKNKVPMGAGPYVATDRSYHGIEKVDSSGFYHNNIVYFQANKKFLLGAPKINKMCYQVVSSSNALQVLQSGSVHFVTPQFTRDNQTTLSNMSSKGFESLSSWQLGYGYIGINAGKVPNVNIRRAIMSAMDTSLALSYYSAGTAANISYPMSLVSWAYPRQEGMTYDPERPADGADTNNGKPWTQFTTDEAAKQKIRDYMRSAGVSAGHSSLTIKFTIAGSNLTEHPTYQTFKKAADLLNECGWNVEVAPDTNALTKLSTGALAVWAAAWSSTIDPDMYQVYHKNSSTTNVIAWGYRDMLANTVLYSYENGVLSSLATVIDAAREIDDQTQRTGLYKTAMGYILDLAIELPCYQRQVLYAYNANVIKKDSLPEKVNPYTSPLARIWEVEFA